MRLHRLRVSAFRGVAERAVSFPDSGVVVLQGPNEVGKSSMVEALDLLLTEKDSSTKAAVRSVKPVGADRGSEVEAELSTGPYRFTYRKRWHVRPRTELTVHSPVPCQLSGVPAHERVRQMLGETLDEQLWRALRLLQGVPLQQEALAGSTALQSALDSAAGDAVASAGEEHPRGHPPGADGDPGELGSFLDAVEQEHARYWTPTGRSTGSAAELERRLADAEAQAEAARRDLDDVARDVERHAELAAELATLTDRRAVEQAERTQREVAWAGAQQLEADLRRRRQEAATAHHASAAAAAALRRRTDAAEQLASRAGSVHRTANAVAALRARVAGLTADLATAQGALGAAGSATQERARAVDEARAAAVEVQAEVDAARAADRWRRVESAAADVGRLEAVVATAGVTDRHVARIERAQEEVTDALARQDQAAATLLVEALGGPVEVTVTTADDGATADDGTAAGAATPGSGAGVGLTVSGSRPHRRAVTGATSVELPGVRVTVAPGGDARALGARVEAARAALRRALAEAGAADLPAARDACRRARDAARDLSAARLRLLEDLAGEDLEALRAQVPARGTDVRPVGDRLVRLQVARDAAGAADAGHREALAQQRVATAARDEVRDELATRTLELVALESTLAAERAEVARLTESLAHERAQVPDDELGRTLAAAREAAAAAGDDEAAAWARFDAADPEALRAQLDAARRAADRSAARWDACRLALAQADGRLDSAGAQGRQDAWDEAQTRREAVRRERDAVHRRALAAAALREAVLRHRDASRRRYVAPFAERVTVLGTQVFGPGFAVHVDDDLRIASRTLDGTTVAWDQLSTGAKEQLAVITRLACAALVDEADGVPVVLDDALGYCDPERLARVADVVAASGRSCQVIVLTCTPQRYATIGSATVVALGA